MSKTKIEWATDTWNPISGCSPCSDGCKNCYARRMANRLKGRFGYPADEPFRVTFHEHRLNEPLKWKKPRTDFPCSMSDLFHNDVHDYWLAKVWSSMCLADQHTFMVLTKRPKRMAEWAFRFFGDENNNPRPVPAHIHLGVTVCNPDELWKVEEVLKIPAANHFVSFEPLLADLGDLKLYLHGGAFADPTEIGKFHSPLDLVIVGGESGPGARYCDPDWIRSVVRQCQSASVPCFVKQIHIKTDKGFRLSKDMSEWPPDLRVRTR